MWFDDADTSSQWLIAEKHLYKSNPKLRPVMKRVGPCTLKPRRDYFVVLCKAIFSQQISTKVAATLFARFRKLFPLQRPTPATVLGAIQKNPDLVMRTAGLSRQKLAYVQDLAQHFVDGRIPTRRLARMSDEEVIEALVGVKGIGRWTAEMFLIFTLNRPNVLPLDDLGLRDGVRDVYGLAERPTAKEVAAIAERWAPFCTVATWYLWRRGSTPITPVK